MNKTEAAEAGKWHVCDVSDRVKCGEQTIRGVLKIQEFVNVFLSCGIKKKKKGKKETQTFDINQVNSGTLQKGGPYIWPSILQTGKLRQVYGKQANTKYSPFLLWFVCAGKQVS